MDLSEVTLESAQPMVNTVFQVTSAEGAVLNLELIEIAPFDLPRRPVRGTRQPKRAPFALYFLGPPEPVLPQRMYDFASPAFELNNLFIVPIGKDEQGTEYEAVFA